MTNNIVAPNMDMVSNFDTKIVTPSITYFQTEYACAVALNGKIQEVIVSYDTITSCILLFKSIAHAYSVK